jgi:hypothetical protein
MLSWNQGYHGHGFGSVGSYAEDVKVSDDSNTFRIYKAQVLSSRILIQLNNFTQIPPISSNPLPFPPSSNQPTTTMQFTLATITALLSLTYAAAGTKRYPATLVERQSGVCGGLATPLCCQTDILGVANLECENGMCESSFPSLFPISSSEG